VALTALRLGAGRIRKDDDIDHAVGVVCLAKRGDRVQSGEPFAEVHADDEAAARAAVAEVRAAYTLADAEPEARPLVLDVIT
jgi:thymidine phosphorylase